MSERKDGGPAFPATRLESVTVFRSDGSDKVETVHDIEYPGMALRDYFAAKAMQGDWAAQNETTGGAFLLGSSVDDLELRAALYYRMADAMMKERNR